MKAAWRFLRRWWWAFLAGLAAIGGVLFAVLVASDDDSPDTQPKSNLKQRAEDQIERIELEGEIEKARVTARASSEREDLDRIEVLSEEDPQEARRQLSLWLNSNL